MKEREDHYQDKKSQSYQRKRSRSRSSRRSYQYKNTRRRGRSRSFDDYSDYSYSYSDYSYSSRSPSPVKRHNRKTEESSKRNEEKDLNSRPIRERLPLPDLGMMRRMMTSIHNSNQNAEIRDKTASQQKLEELERKLGYRR